MELVRLSLLLVLALSIATSRTVVVAQTPSTTKTITTDSRTFGTHRVLAVRVLSSTQEPGESIQDIDTNVFGSHPGSVMNQYQAVSHGQLTLQRVGVIEIQVDRVTNYQFMMQNMTSQIKLFFGNQPLREIADRILYCMPDGALDEGTWGLAALPGRFSLYHKSGCSDLGLVMHELGHNNGFDHSNYIREYGDKTGYMGGSKIPRAGIMAQLKKWVTFQYHSKQLGFPQKAFNGHKHWQSQWFSDRAEQIDESVSTLWRLVSFVEYSNIDLERDDVVLLKLGDAYIQYNRAKAYNEHTDLPNTVTITESRNGTASERLVALLRGHFYQYEYNESLFTIQVCDLTQKRPGEIDYALIAAFPHGDRSLCPNGFVRRPQPWSVLVDQAILQSSDPLLKTIGMSIVVSSIMLFLLMCFAVVQWSYSWLRKWRSRQTSLHENNDNPPSKAVDGRRPSIRDDHDDNDSVHL